MEARPSLKATFCRVEIMKYFVSVLFIFIFVFAQIPKTTSTEPPPPFMNSTSLEASSKTISRSTCTTPTTLQGMLLTQCSGHNTIPTKNVPSQREIQELDMSSGNKLQTLTDGQLERANLPKLLKLILRRCQIISIQRGAFRGGHRLQQLYLEGNQIEVLDPRVFDGLTNLQTLYLGHNPINRFQLETVFPALTSLQRLDVSSCALSFLPENTFDNLRNLKRLDLDTNVLSTISWKLFRNLFSLATVSLGNNPLNCNCHLRFLVDFLSDKAPNVTNQCGNTRYLSCPPKVEKLNFRSQAKEQIQVGDDIYFECTYSGYPSPTVKWLKDGKVIQVATDISLNNNNDTRSASGLPMTTQNRTQEIVSKFGIDELERNYNFKQVLKIRKAKAGDTGNYDCVIENEGGQREKAVFFKLNESTLDSRSDGDCGMKLRVWIELAILGVLILLFLLLIVMFARRVCGNRKQNIIMDFGELNYIQEAISLQHLSTEKGTSRSNVSSSLLH